MGCRARPRCRRRLTMVTASAGVMSCSMKTRATTSPVPPPDCGVLTLASVRSAERSIPAAGPAPAPRRAGRGRRRCGTTWGIDCDQDQGCPPCPAPGRGEGVPRRTAQLGGGRHASVEPRRGGGCRPVWQSRTKPAQGRQGKPGLRPAARPARVADRRGPVQVDQVRIKSLTVPDY